MFTNYRYIDAGSGIEDSIVQALKEEDGLWWAISKGNPHWDTYQSWLEAGNIPLQPNEEPTGEA